MPPPQRATNRRRILALEAKEYEVLKKVGRFKKKHKSRFDSTFGLRRSLIWRKILAAESDCEHWLDIEIGNRKS